MQMFPLLSTQSGIWLAEQVSDQNNLFVIAHNVEMRGSIDPEILQKAIRSAMTHADTVRARFVSCDDVAMQEFNAVDVAQIPVEVIDLQDNIDAEGEVHRLTRDDLSKDLRADGDAPLMRHIIMRLPDLDGAPRWVWYQRYHHIMLDGYSFTALTRRTAELYCAFLKGEEPTSSPFSSTEPVLAEYEAYQASDAFQRDKEFWSQYCADLPPVVRLPSDREFQPGYDKTIVSEIRTLRHISAVDLEKIGNKITSVDLLISAVALYLARMTGQDEQVIGVPFMRRMGSAAMSSSAPVVNILPLRVSFEPGTSIAQMAQGVAKSMRKLRRHQRYDTARIQRDIGLVGTGRRLFGPLVNYRMFDYELKFGDVAGRTEHLATGPVEDIEFGLLTHDGQVSIELRADGGLYSQDELSQHAARLQNLMEIFIKDPDVDVAHIDMMTPQDRENIALWSRVTPFTHNHNWKTIVDVFADQVGRTPDTTALVCGDVKLSFTEMSQQIFRLARCLMARGIGRGDVVAVAMPRSEQGVITTFAVMAAGAVHLALDITYPRNRIEGMFEDAHPRLVLTCRAGDQALPETVERLYLDDETVLSELEGQRGDIIDPNERLQPQHASDSAYIIFTSGSTGRPKGVVIRHSSVLNLFRAERDLVYIPALAQVWKKFSGRPLRAAHTHTFAFDSYWLMLFWVLLGQEVHILDEDMRRDAHALAQEVDRQKFDSLDLTPSLCAQMIESGLLEETRHHPSMITIGGEAVPASLWQRFRECPEIQVWNAYGPTEFTVDAVLARLSDSETPVIGRPIDGVQVQVLDYRLENVPPGGVGEMYLSGEGIAAGYIGRADLTAQRFVAHPHQHGQLMYRTGDLVRYNMAGNLEYLGRSDHQVKIRGFRIEIGEIELAMEALPGVAQALVMVEDLGHIKRLVGYCSPERGVFLADDVLKDQLRHHLPDYMVPAALIILDEFPLTPVGKVDRDRLPTPQVVANVRPKNRAEKLVCDQVAQLLKLTEVGTEADFFALGGDSISAMVLCNAARKQGYFLSPKHIFEGKTLKSIAQKLTVLPLQKGADASVNTASLDDIKPYQSVYGEVEDFVPLLPSQKGVLFQAQSGQRGGQYNSHTQLHLKGNLDRARLKKAFDLLLVKHPQLGAVIDTEVGDEPVLVLPKLNGGESWPWYDHDLSELDEAMQEEEVTRLTQEAVKRNLLGTGFRQLISGELIRLSTHHHVLVVVIHHIIVDGWSAPILLRDLFAAYETGDLTQTSDAGYTSVIRQLLGRDPQAARNAWHNAMTDVEATRLFDHVKLSDTVDETEYFVNEETSATLLAEAKKRGVTLNSLMQSVWAMVLGSMLGRDEIVFGTPSAGRSAPIAGIEDQIGMFLNTVPVRAGLCPDRSLWDQASILQNEQMNLIEHDELGLAEIQQIAGAGSLFDTLLIVENYPDHNNFVQEGAGLQIDQFQNRGYSHYPLTLVVLPGERIRLLVESRGAIASPEALAKRVGSILDELVRHPKWPLAAFNVASTDDLLKIERENSTTVDLPDLCVRDLLLAQTGRTPDAIALVDETVSLSFRDVRHQVLELVTHLRDLGVKRGDVVAVALERSARLTIALLGACEIGATFLPLDLSYPVQRLAYMLDDSKPNVIITDSAIKDTFDRGYKTFLFDGLFDPDHEVRDLDDPGIRPQDPCYILYTSGTTGQPKGVVVSNAAFVNYLLWVQDTYPLTQADVVLQKTPCGFDVSLTEFFWPFICGARLVMAGVDAHREPAQVIDLIEKYNVTFTDFVPSMLALFVGELRAQNKAHACRSLRQIICVGEALARHVVREFNDLLDAEVLNLYGPTEATIELTHASASKALLDGKGDISIGRPAWNTQLRILDHYLRPVPPGVAGELYLCGAQLAIGYLNRPDLTASRFVADPMTVGQRMYRTGDLACWRSDGQVEYLGRVDDQIKIAGQRVELGEIESQLKTIAGVDLAVVVAAKSGVDIRLVAYIAAQGVDTRGILKSLGEILPQHMIPATIIPLAQMPLSATGKLDRKALPEPELNERCVGRVPASEEEIRIAAIFKDLLGLQDVGADEDFFAIGGHSLLAMKLAARVRREFDVKITVGQIIAQPTIEKLAEHIFLGDRVNNMARDGFDPVLEFRKGTGSPLVCCYPGSGISWKFNVLSRHVPSHIPIIAFQSPRPDGPIATSQNIDELCDKQLDILLNVQPDGPYYLLGYSLGGGVAYGLATRLKAMGKEVRFVGMLDTYPKAGTGNKDGLGQFEKMIIEEMSGGEDEEKNAILEHLLHNIRDANRLVRGASAPQYDGHVTLFAAGHSRPADMDPKQIWLDYARSVTVYDFPERTHFDIMSPASMEEIGPLIATLIGDLYDKQASPHFDADISTKPVSLCS